MTTRLIPDLAPADEATVLRRFREDLEAIFRRPGVLVLGVPKREKTAIERMFEPQQKEWTVHRCPCCTPDPATEERNERMGRPE